jgi:predicted MFS family arabinose efflux permease
VLKRALAKRFPVLGVRDFRILMADRLIAPASVGFSMVGVSFAVLNATGSAADLSYVLAAQIAPSLVFTLLGGVAADRFPPLVCAASFLLGVLVEMMMVQWTVALTRRIPPERLARVSSYDLLGSVMAMPAGALIAGRLGATVGISRTQFLAAAAIVFASVLALIPRDIWTITSNVDHVAHVDQSDPDAAAVAPN